ATSRDQLLRACSASVELRAQSGPAPTLSGRVASGGARALAHLELRREPARWGSRLIANRGVERADRDAAEFVRRPPHRRKRDDIVQDLQVVESDDRAVAFDALAPHHLEKAERDEVVDGEIGLRASPCRQALLHERPTPFDGAGRDRPSLERYPVS